MPRRRIVQKAPEPQGADVSDVTEEIYGGEIPTNKDGTVASEGEVEIGQIQRIGALGAESVSRNRIESRKIQKARNGEAVRWNETDARVMFDNCKKAWPTGIKIYIKRTEPDERDFRPVDMSSLRDSTAFYDYIVNYIHTHCPAASYTIAFRDGVERGKATLRLPATNDAGGDSNMSNRGVPGGGLPYPPPPYGGGYYPPQYQQGYPQGQQGYPPPQYPQYPQGQQGYPPAPPPQYPPPAAAAPPAPVAASAPQSPQPEPVPQQHQQQPQYPPQYPPPQYQQPPQQSPVEQQVSTLFWQTRELGELVRQQQLQHAQTIGMVEAALNRLQPQATPIQQQPAPQAPMPMPAQQPAPYGGPAGYAHMPPPGAPVGMSGAAPVPPGYPPQYAQQQQPFTQPQYSQQPAQQPQYQQQPPAQQQPSIQQQLQGKMQEATQLFRAMKQMHNDFGRIVNLDADDDETTPPGFPQTSPTPEAPPPFMTMPLGGPDAPQYAYNPQDGSPHWLGIGLANMPKIVSFFDKVANALARVEADKRAAAGGDYNPTITVAAERPQMQQTSQAPQAPQQQAPRTSGLPPISAFRPANT